MGTFFDSFAPALTGSLAQAGPQAIQGHLQGLEASKQLALLDMQLKSQALQQQHVQQQMQLATKPQPFNVAPGHPYGSYDPMTGSINMQGYAAFDPATQRLKEAQAKYYESTPFYKGETTLEKNATLMDMSPHDYMLFQSQLRPTVTEVMDPNNPATAIKIDAKTGKVIGESPKFSAEGRQFRVAEGAARSFSSGKSKDQVVAFNTAIAHLETLSKLAAALNTGDLQSVNKWRLAVQQQLGIGEVPATFDAIKQLVAGEIVKTVSVSGGGVEERLAASNALNKALSPSTLQAVIAGETDILRGKLDALKLQYNASGVENILGPFDKFMTPLSKRQMGPQAESPMASKSPMLNKPKPAPPSSHKTEAQFSAAEELLTRQHPDWDTNHIYQELSRQGF